MASWELKSGTVSRVSQKGLQIEGDEQWYNANFNPEYFTDVSVGDEVVFNYASKEKNGKTFLNIMKQPEIKSLNISAEKRQGLVNGTSNRAPVRMGEPLLHRERLILNQNALSQAVSYWQIVSNAGESPDEDDILATAKKFVAWTSGDVDLPEKEPSSSERLSHTNEAMAAAVKALDELKVA